MTSGDPATLLNDKVAFRILDIKGGNVTAQTAGHQLQLACFFTQSELAGLKEHFQHLLRGVAQSTQKNRRRQFAATVDTNEHGVLGIELEVEPGATVRNHPGRVQQLAG